MQTLPEAGKDGNRFSLELPEGASLLTHWELQNNHLRCVKPRVHGWGTQETTIGSAPVQWPLLGVPGLPRPSGPAPPQATEVPSSKWAPSLGV